MASKTTSDEMKKDLRKISSNINMDLLATLMGYMSISEELRNKFKNPHLFFGNQLLNNELCPWTIAKWLKSLNHTQLAIDFETFAEKYNFPQESIDKAPEIAIMQLFKYLKSEITQDELYGMRNSISETFEAIFRDFGYALTPSLEELKIKLQDEDREDLAYKLTTDYIPIISTMEPVLFSRTVKLCLDTLDVNIFSLLTALRETLSKEYSTYRTLSIHSKKFSYSADFIPLTFTKEVDTRTLPLTEGSDAELLTLMKYSSKQEKQTKYINAHTEIYSSALNGKLISLIGHPGTGKTFYCNKLINDYVTHSNDSFRFVFLVACRDNRWHKLEENCVSNPGEISTLIKQFFQFIIPIFPHSEELTRIILQTEGNGMLLVIDSFDEFPQKFHFNSTLLCSILKRQVLSKCTILITSRPGAWNQLISGYGSELSFDDAWQILGFSPDQRDLFINTTLSQYKATTCKKYLQTHPELDILTLVPVNISLLTGLIDSTALLSNIHTLTDMYINLVLFTLNNELNRYDKKSPTITRLNNLPEDMQAQFDTLAELAYQGLIKRQITFSPEEFPDIQNMSNKYKKGLGLFNIITVNTVHLTTIDYLSCPHLTLQEFLSAWHLAQKSTTDITSILLQTFTDDTWPAIKMCIRFLCGLLTKDHNTIISIITHNMYMPCTPLFKCKYLLIFYPQLNQDNTDTHLSILPYVLETNQPSIITSYYKLMCPADNTIPHFFLPDSITPVDTYSLTQYFSLLPHNTTIAYSISVLYIDLSLLNSIQLDMLADSINNISIDTLLVRLSSITDYTTLMKYSVEQIPIFIEDMKYEIQQLHINSNSCMPTLLDEFNHITENKNKINIYKLQKELSPLNLPITISNSFIQTDNSHFLKMLSCMHKITTSLHPPEQIYYHFNNVSFLEDIIINTLIDTISSTAIYVKLSACYITPQFITTLVSSLHKLEYLDIFNLSFFSYFKSEITAQSFKKLEERNMKGLYLSGVLIQNDSILNNYLQSQSSLQEIYLYNTTDSTLATLHAIKHLTSLQYFFILANDRALANYYRTVNSQSTTTEDAISAYLNILYTNRHTLSYVDFNRYDYFLSEHYTVIMPILSQCTNLQYINLSFCRLKLLHMQVLATTINQLHGLLYINMLYNRDITEEAIITLTDALATHNTVIWINLSDCSLSSVPVIISLITKFPCLLRIELDSNEFSDTSKEELKMFTKQRKINLDI